MVKSKNKGFTLIEIIIAFALFSLIIIGATEGISKSNGLLKIRAAQEEASTLAANVLSRAELMNCADVFLNNENQNKTDYNAIRCQTELLGSESLVSKPSGLNYYNDAAWRSSDNLDNLNNLDLIPSNSTYRWIIKKDTPAMKDKIFYVTLNFDYHKAGVRATDQCSLTTGIPDSVRYQVDVYWESPSGKMTLAGKEYSLDHYSLSSDKALPPNVTNSQNIVLVSLAQGRNNAISPIDGSAIAHPNDEGLASPRPLKTPVQFSLTRTESGVNYGTPVMSKGTGISYQGYTTSTTSDKIRISTMRECFWVFNTGPANKTFSFYDGTNGSTTNNTIQYNLQKIGR